MISKDAFVALNHVLAGIYPFVDDSYRIVDAAGIPKTHVAFQRRAIDNWYQILLEADKRDKVADIVRAALEDYPDNPILIQAEQGKLGKLKGPVIDKDVNWK